MAQKSFISGCEGLSLTPEEAGFFRAEKPWGFILFARNLESGDQIRRLCAALREAADDPQAPIFIDQEGGRVRRLRPPLVLDYPPGSVYGALYAEDAEAGLRAAWLGARLIAHDLTDLGITGNCLPILDVRQLYGSHIIGDRAYGDAAGDVAAIGRVVAQGHAEGGVLPVMKHVPGHGRARLDSHDALPIVDADATTLESVDFSPFHTLRDLPLAMTAHIVYEAYDPDRPATTSQTVIDAVIRGMIGFDGALMTDDLSMNALSGSLDTRTAESLAAGCDLALHCNGDMVEMRAVASASVELSGQAKRRTDAARAALSAPQPCDRKTMRAEFDALVARVAAT
ncbi:MAG: beta-N-acetylhexosaminidase [Pseudomonadota bacterium]